MVFELATTAQRVHRCGGDVQARGDVANGELWSCQAGPDRSLGRGTKGGTKLRDTRCGSMRLMREPGIPRCNGFAWLRVVAGRCGTGSSPSHAEEHRFEWTRLFDRARGFSDPPISSVAPHEP